MRRVVEFLELLDRNNNREWFNANKSLYKEALAEFTEFTSGLIEGISTFDATVGGQQAKDCIYRIYRDTRFSADKRPYKTHFGCFIVPHGKRSGYAGYYVHIEPTENGMLGCSLLATGLVMPEPPILRSIREEILDYGRELEQIVAASDGFRFSLGNSLKRNPQGFPAATEFDYLLRLRDHFIEKPLSRADILSPSLPERCVEAFRTTKPYLDHLNRAIDYAREELM